MLLLKVGGGAQIDFDAVARDLAAHPAREKVVVLGANACREDVAGRTGAELTRLQTASGRESLLCDKSYMDLMWMSYAGLQRGRFVSACQAAGLNAMGLSGLDGGLVVGRVNPGIRVRQGGRTLLVRDRSGRCESLNLGLLRHLLAWGVMPVITLPWSDGVGGSLVGDNDDLMVLLARHLHPEEVIFLHEAPGILRRKECEDSRLETVSYGELTGLLQTWGKEGIGRKLRAARDLLDLSVGRVLIADGRCPAPILEGHSRGTLLEGPGVVA